MNVPVRCNEFVPGSSEVDVALKVTDGRPWQPEDPDDDRWDNREKAFSKVNKIYINQKQTLK